ncbi:MAG: hypothetical protein AAF799_29190 [Myxococcota bacterium]
MKIANASTMVVLGAALSLLAGCAVEDDGRVAQGSDEGEREDAGADVDASGSCFRSCGGSGSEACWCDEQCSLLGDCCSDYRTLCVEADEAGGGEPEDGGEEDLASCVGFCDGVAPSGCECHDGCEETGTCCVDYEATCVAEEPCVKNVVLMGYWPPTNEMLRQWSTNPKQNHGVWTGENWGGYGYDVHAFFPEFPPDGDPSNDPFGSEGRVGSRDFDLQVDYQATSEDFWRIVDELEPTILITTSRGGSIGWEIEAIEGGHGGGESVAFDWSSDGYGDQTHPTRDSIDERSWDAISTWRAGNVLPTELPVDAIVAATEVLDLTSVEIDETGTSGNYLSGFLGLHGLAYARTYPDVLAAGHIHVGIDLPSDDAQQLMEASLHAVLQTHAADATSCR